MPKKPYDKKHGLQLRKVYAANQKAKGLVSYSVYLQRQAIDKLKRLSRRFHERDSTYLRTWTRTSLITRSISTLYSQVFTSTTQNFDPVVFEGACTDNIRAGYVPVYRYLKTRFHSGPRRDLVCDTRQEAIEKARRPNGELRKDFVGVLEIRYKVDSKKEGK